MCLAGRTQIDQMKKVDPTGAAAYAAVNKLLSLHRTLARYIFYYLITSSIFLIYSLQITRDKRLSFNLEIVHAFTKRRNVV